MLIRRFASLSETPWPNGKGRRADILQTDAALVSFAWLDMDAPFSALPGQDRTVTLVEGPGFTLHFEGRPAMAASHPGQTLRFDGALAPYCTIAGPCTVLSAMAQRDRWVPDIRVSPLEAGEAASPADALAAVLLSGRAIGADGEALQRFDAVVGGAIALRATAPSVVWTMACRPRAPG